MRMQIANTIIIAVLVIIAVTVILAEIPFPIILVGAAILAIPVFFYTAR